MAVRGRVLFVIDDDLRLAAVTGSLERCGIAVDGTDDPYGAEDRVAAVPRHRVILLGVLLPTREVYRLCGRLRAWTGVPIVIAV